MPIKAQVIYAIKNKVNGKTYIGSTNNFYYRKSGHLSSLRKGRHHSPILQRAFNKYGESAFDFVILERVSDPTQLMVREQKYLDLFKPPYNIAPASDRPPSQKGRVFTEAHKANMSAALKGRVSPMKGKKFTAQHRANLSAARKGHGRPFGYHPTEEAIENMRRSQKGHSHRPPKDPKATRLKRTASLKAWYATEEGRKDRERKSREGEARAHFLKTNCKICNGEITYQLNGKQVPKTCSPECLTELRRKILETRRKLDPESDRRAGLTPKRKKVVCQRSNVHAGAWG